jgi:hypothetical protein
LRRSNRNKEGGSKIQDREEAAKKNNNEISGKMSSFHFNYVDPNFLENIASNINLGESAADISANISSIQANELAKATFVTVRQKV